MPQPDIYELIERVERKVERLHAKMEALVDLDTTQFSAIAASQKAILAQLALVVQSIEPPLPAAYLQFIWDQGVNMPVSLVPGESLGCTIAPLTSSGGASAATLSASSFVSSDPTVFTVAPDPANPNTRFIVTAATTLPGGLDTDAATVTASATATETDGVTTEQVSGVDTVTVNAATPPPPPPPGVAASLGFTWDTPASKRK